MLNNNQREAALGVIKNILDQSIAAGLFKSADQVLVGVNAYNILAAPPMPGGLQAVPLTPGSQPAIPERQHADGSAPN